MAGAHAICASAGRRHCVAIISASSSKNDPAPSRPPRIDPSYATQGLHSEEKRNSRLKRSFCDRPAAVNTMILHVTRARYLDRYRIGIWFNDVNHGIVDLDDDDFFDGVMFEPLRDPDIFASFSVDLKINTLVWPNGAALAPEYLEERLITIPDRQTG